MSFGSYPEAAIYDLCQTLVLVEGAEDAAGIYARLAIEGRLDGFRKYGCHIVPVGSKSMLIKPIAMAKHLEIPTFVVIDLTSPSLIWSNFTSKNRNVFRKAAKLGVKVYRGRSPQLFHQFQEMYNQTMDVLGAVPYYYFERDFYESILSDLGHNSLIFYATYQERTIAMALILMCSERMHYHLSCSEKDYRQYAATKLLLYEAALWGHEI